MSGRISAEVEVNIPESHEVFCNHRGMRTRGPIIIEDADNDSIEERKETENYTD